MRDTLADPCFLCGGGRRKAIDVERWSVARCRACGVHTLWPRPEGVAQEGFDDGSGYEVAIDLADGIVARHHRSLASVERFVRPGRLLDVGCGAGFLLETARERGWEATGVDPSPWAIARARRAGFAAHEGRLEDLDLPASGFDAVALLQVVEHLPDPRPLLGAARRLLRTGGALLVATPNPRSLLALVKRERFNYWIPPVHCTWYTPRALNRVLRATGFTPVRSTTWSARARGLHDGVDVVSQVPVVRRLPGRTRRWAGEAVARAADAAGLGSITEQVALRWEA